MKERIKMVRKAAGLNQSEFGSRIGVTQPAIAGYESGVRTPLDAVIVAICKEYGINEEWLRTGEGEPYQDRSNEEQIAQFFGEVAEMDDDSLTKQFIAGLAKMNKEQRDTFERLGGLLLDAFKNNR